MVNLLKNRGSKKIQANNQWKIKEDLGSTIMESAFARALTGGVKGTVMVLDHEVQPLTRSSFEHVVVGHCMCSHI